jgi:hypothetical protein
MLKFVGLAALTWTAELTANVNAAEDESKPRVIPLKEIWAYEMPGTRNVWELEPDKFGIKVRNLGSEEQIKRHKESLTYQIVRHLVKTKRGVQPPGFAVLGSGKAALQEAHDVLVDGQKRLGTFPANTKISLAFFSKAFEYYVHLDKVEQHGNKITIRYFFVPHRESVSSAHFAVIPLGELRAGKWEVDVVRSPWPNARKYSVYPEPGADADPIVVCRPFSFVVERQATK